MKSHFIVISLVAAATFFSCATPSFAPEHRAKCDAPLLMVVDRWASAPADSMIRVLVGVYDSTSTFDRRLEDCGARVTRLGPTFVGLDVGTKAIPCVAALPGVQRMELDAGAAPL
jgi:hypothetical protein